MVTRVICHKKALIDPLPARRKLLYAKIERGIDKEWKTMRSESTAVKVAREAFPIAGGQWLGEETMVWEQQTLLTRFLVWNMYLGSIHLPRDDVSDVFCPIFGYELNRIHVIDECRSLDVDSSRIKEAVTAEFGLYLS